MATSSLWYFSFSFYHLLPPFLPFQLTFRHPFYLRAQTTSLCCDPASLKYISFTPFVICMILTLAMSLISPAYFSFSSKFFKVSLVIIQHPRFWYIYCSYCHHDSSLNCFLASISITFHTFRIPPPPHTHKHILSFY